MSRWKRSPNRSASGGGIAHVQPGDLTRAGSGREIGDFIGAEIGRLDILVNNAGVNINDRHWDKLTPENAKLMIDGNLAAAAQCVTVALPMMRAQQDGLIIHTASMAGPLYRRVPGAALHRRQARHRRDEPLDQHAGMRQRHPLLRVPARRGGDPDPRHSGRTRSALRSAPAWCSREDCADLILYIALLPKRLTMNEVMLSPTWNRGYVAAIRQLSNL